MFYRKYVFGDTAVYYIETPVEGHEGKTAVGLAAYPADLDVQPQKLHCDSLVQVAFTGDELLVDYTGGVTMRNRGSTLLHVERQTADGRSVETVLSDGRGNFYIHRLRYAPEHGVFTVNVTYENRSQEVRPLEYLASVSLSGIAALSVGGNGTCGLTLHRMTSAWSRECRLKSEPFSALGLDMSWARYGVKSEKWGQNGSMPDRGWYPFAAIEDEEGGVIWGFTVEAPFSWQMEVYQEKETCAFSGGLADYESGHWRKDIPPQGSFTTHNAYFTVKSGGLNAVCNAFVHEADSRLRVPVSEEEMPVLFNEYCTTWGVPSRENIRAILSALRGLPVRTFAIDCGWYKPQDKGWCNAIGDWRVSKELFPEGIAAAAEDIAAAGMRAGIWFEFEVAGRDSECFTAENMLLRRDGRTITAKNRRFLDLRKAEVKEYLGERFLAVLKENGFGYLKIDYNDTYGIGCDGAESPGEGGRQVAEESILWLDRLREELPDLVIENCSSGGGRIEPLRMSKVSMCSFSDAHECAEIPFVAANVSRVVPARQIQIWAVLRENESDARTVYSLCAAMIGRICLSGDVLHLTDGKRALLKEGLDFYGEIKEIVRYGDLTEIDCNVEYYRAPWGRQIYQKEYNGRRLVIVHALQCPEPVEIALKGYRLVRAFTDVPYSYDGEVLRLSEGKGEAWGFSFAGGLFPLGEEREYRAGAFLFAK